MERLNEMRRNASLTQFQVAKHLGVARNTYSRYETGEREPDVETLKKLAAFFGTTSSYLIGETDDPSPPGANVPCLSPSELVFLEKYRALDPDKRRALDTLLE